MKNQYFGDNRDLFKYDLVLRIIKEGLVNRFTFIPMLTRRNTKAEGEQRNRSKAKAGYENLDLIEFLDSYDNKSKRDKCLGDLDVWFKKQDVKTAILRNDFYHAERAKYFQGARKGLLPKSVICVDPDIGLEPEVQKPKDQHILYSEIKELYEQMDNGSILMIFQFIPRKKREAYFSRACRKLKQKVGGLPVYISDNQIVFFFLTKGKSLRKSLSNILTNYKGSYPKLEIGSANNITRESKGAPPL